MEVNRIICGDALKVLKEMPSESIDAQICSPPYWGLRDYGKDVEVDFGDWKGQLGLEPNFNLYIKHLLTIFDEVKRVLKKDGVCWINLGDTYLGSMQGYGSKPGQGSGIQDVTDGYFAASKRKPPMAKYKLMAKCLAGIPERFMLGMIDRGWILRNKIIWHKPNHMPTSVKDRFANSWEYLFMFVKSKKYYFDLDAVREAHKTNSIARAIRGTSGKDKETKGNPYYAYPKEFKPHGILDERALNPKGKNPDDVIQIEQKMQEEAKERGYSQHSASRTLTHLHQVGDDYSRNPLGKNPNDVLITKGIEREYTGRYGNDGKGMMMPQKWNNPLGKTPDDFFNITTQPFKEAHFAVFPEKLVERPIKVTKKDAIILDIFAGSGTVGVVAKRLGRDYILIDIKPEYCEMARRRLAQVERPLK